MAVTTDFILQNEDHARDAAFYKTLHGKSTQSTGGIRSMLGKDAAAQQAAVDEYFKHWDSRPADAANETEETRLARRQEYAALTRHYYDLATDFYEYGWGTSFHFCRFAPGESFPCAIARHEHYLALKMGIERHARVLDVGCGVGGPARELIKFVDCSVVGFNNNDYQLARSLRYAEKEGLATKYAAVKGDFMQMQFADDSFDAVYSIESTVHAPSLKGVYSEIFRVLKPGGVFGVYEWLMTDAYDNDDSEHRAIRRGIEQGNGISNMVTVSEGLEAIKAAGFELEYHEDLAERNDPIPWYYALAGDIRHLQTVGDLLTILRLTWWGRGLVHKFLGYGETLRFTPPGTQKTADNLALAADSLVAGGKKKLFTPMYMMVARKPSNRA